MSARLLSEHAWINLRRNCPIQRVRGKIRAVRPAYGTIFVYPNLCGQNRIAQGFKNRAEEPCGEIHLSAPAIVKQHFKRLTLSCAHAHKSFHFLLQRRDRRERVVFLPPDPIIAKLRHRIRLLPI
jgi:hypothetical protein